MPSIQHVWPWGEQPPDGAGINWDHQRAQGLVFFAPLGNAHGFRDLVRSRELTRTGLVTDAVVGNVRTKLFGSSSYLDITPPASIGPTTPFTLSWTQQYTAAAATSVVLNVNFGAAGTHKSFCVLQSATAGYYFVAGPRAAVAVPTWGSIGVPVNHRPNRYVLQCFGGSQATSNSDYALWRDGKLIAPSGGSSITNHTGAIARIGARDTGADPFEGAILDLRMWARILSDADALEESRLERAGDLYEPLRIWVPVSAGGGSYTLTAESGSYTLAGQAAGLQAARTLAADAGSYTLTGQAAGLARGQRLAAEQGAYALTGVDAVLATARVLAADAGAYALNGQAVGLTYTPAGSYSLTAEAGSYSLNGQPVDLTAARSLSAESGSYSLTGQDVGLAKFAGYTLGADAGSYALTGNEAVFDRTWVLLAESGSYALSGSPVTLTWSGEAAPEVVIPAGAGTGPVSQRSRPAADPRERGARQVQMHNQRAIAALMAIVSALD